MEFQKLIESRRSIRKYDGSKKVTKEQIETLIAAATEAPSWKNSETARYYCSQRRDDKEGKRGVLAWI